MAFRWMRSLVVCALIFGLGVSLHADPPQSPAKPVEAKKDDVPAEKKKEDDDKNKGGILNSVDPNFVQQFTLTLSSAVGALIAIQTIPASFRASWKAIAKVEPKKTIPKSVVFADDED